MFEVNNKVEMKDDHLWNPNNFCSAYAHEGESGYIKEIKEDAYVLMLNSKWSPAKPNDYREHEVKLEHAVKYIKLI